MSKKRIQLENELHRYGKRVLDSREFQLALQQTHHAHTSVGEHMLLVAWKSLEFCHLLRLRGIHVNTEAVVVAALCHDLGIVGRDEKYANNRECCHQHPIDSAEIAGRIIPEISDQTRKIILRHMWPLSLHPPGTWEEWVVTMADKYVSIQGVFESRIMDWFMNRQKQQIG